MKRGLCVGSMLALSFILMTEPVRAQRSAPNYSGRANLALPALPAGPEQQTPEPPLSPGYQPLPAEKSKETPPEVGSFDDIPNAIPPSATPPPIPPGALDPVDPPVSTFGVAPLPGASLDSLSAALRNLLLSNMPDVLYEKQDEWGRTSMTRTIRQFRIVRIPKKDGNWRKLRVTPRGLPGSLELHLSNLRRIDKDRVAFHAAFAMMANVEYEQQLWENGIRFYSGSSRARMRIVMHLDIENTVRFEDKGGLVPDLMFRLKVTQAKVDYNNLVVEHIAGIGGTGAKLIGEALRSTIVNVRPSLERQLLERASRTLVKAGDTREVRVSLNDLLR